jgi:hypothetical protein
MGDQELLALIAFLRTKLNALPPEELESIRAQIALESA